MKHLSFILRLLCGIALISIGFSIDLAAQNGNDFSPWVKKKVRQQHSWYAQKGMDLKDYDWSDDILNEHLGALEATRVKKNIFTGVAGLHSLGALLYFAAAGGVNENHNFNCPSNVVCDADYVRKVFRTAGGINVAVAIPFWVVSGKNKKQMDAALVNAMERFRKIR